MTVASPSSWGGHPRVASASVHAQAWPHLPLPEVAGSLLAHGCGRSYGDSCLNEGGTLLTTRAMNRLIAFDSTTGILRAEAGATLGEIVEVVVPRGWFLPVSPGTRHVTLGGALANDVHGKNHHRAGSFGHHVRAFELLRSDGSRTLCTPHGTPELFRATVGGLGLTGFVTWVEIALKRLGSAWIDSRTQRFGALEEFFALDAQSACQEYTVAWIDALGPHAGRGHFISGDHAPDDDASLREYRLDPAFISVPFDFPPWILNRTSMAAFNAMKFRSRGVHPRNERSPLADFFYPLDAIGHWNRIYGRRGFLQHQCVIPPASAPAAIAEMLRQVSGSGQGSFLAVLKGFGTAPPPGMLSFARPGTTLALDFPLRGDATFALLDRLDAVVREASGAVYPAKDARMSRETFRRSFPAWETFATHVDARFSSSFWRRVGAAGSAP